MISKILCYTTSVLNMFGINRSQHFHGGGGGRIVGFFFIKRGDFAEFARQRKPSLVAVPRRHHSHKLGFYLTEWEYLSCCRLYPLLFPFHKLRTPPHHLCFFRAKQIIFPFFHLPANFCCCVSIGCSCGSSQRSKLKRWRLPERITVSERSQHLHAKM